MTRQGEPLWRPSAARVAAAAITRFRAQEASGCADSVALHQWSLSDPSAFWDAVWRFCGVVGDRNGGSALQGDPADMLAARFFPTARLNYAENMLAGGDRSGAATTAVVALTEDGQRTEVTWSRLRDMVTACRGWLRAAGVGPGDHVAAWAPNGLPALVALLAANSIGAVFTSTSPDFGVAGVLDRFRQVEPVVLIAADGYRYGGRAHDRLTALGGVVAGLPSIRAVALHRMLAHDVPDRVADVPAVGWDELMAAAAPPDPVGLQFVRQPLRAPGLVLYSSGTTGVPKCIVHSAGGVLIKQLTEHQLHCDVRPGDRVFYYTTTGWMMWNWLVTALASGATVILYDGSPFHPGPEAMWDLAQAERVTLFGTSAKFLDACAKAGVAPRRSHDLSPLRTITSTGSPLSAEGFGYVYDRVGADLHLASISGGTDLCGCFVIGDPTRPVHAGEIQGPALGTAADVWDDEGRSLRDRPGARGELVCTAAFPSMPLGFAGDADGSRYRSAYFERYPGVWAHGDFASRTEHDGFVIHGRSDATLNAGGVRIGTAEIYRQVEQLPQVAECLAIGQEWDGDTRIVLFVRLAEPGAAVDDDLRLRIRTTLREQCSPRHVPARIVGVTDLPRTRSGKLAELAVADVVHGRPVRNTAALANPESLELFRRLPELQQ